MKRLLYVAIGFPTLLVVLALLSAPSVPLAENDGPAPRSPSEGPESGQSAPAGDSDLTGDRRAGGLDGETESQIKGRLHGGGQPVPTIPWRERLDRPYRSGPLELTAELIDECLQVAEDIDRTLADHLRTLQEKDPAKFEQRLRQSERLIGLVRLKQRDRWLYERKILELRVDAEVARLAAEARVAFTEGRTADAEAMSQQLRGQVILQECFRITAREEYLVRLQELVGQIEQELEAQKDPQNFERLVEQRMEQLLAGAGSPSEAPAPAEDAEASSADAR
jgi:hypothetical protein